MVLDLLKIIYIYFSDVQVDEHTLNSLNQSAASSSTSSMSAKSLGSMESPSNSVLEIGADNTQVTRDALLENDSDVDVETELPTLEVTIPKTDIRGLKKIDKKRQEVINGMYVRWNNEI